MNNIIICEDDVNQRKQLESILATEIKKFNCKIALSTDNPHEVIRHIDNRTNSFVYFLDVDLNSDLNGFELAKLIRTYDPNGYIIFLTGHAELTLLTFQYKVQALDYIIKGDVNILKTKVADCLNAVHTTLNAAKAKVDTKISIEVGNNVVLLDFEDILFFETAGKEHKISVHTFNGQSEFYGTLKNIEKTVSSDFYKTHRSYLVNTKKIKSIDKNNMVIEMVNDEICYVSLRYLKGLLKKCLH
ncbi:accessory protein regulator protein A [Clostridium puniceum]|uniref:Stage 0 sporulation protein A homolog n=1 Tax=Clostridium puniceum TaxID=29367 RepID=A0A1S8TPP2_9CLOT|nr:LytTR family DNA-binding domain-containing protein [Clostridium puniceum]OOM79584.1 accessory protein regulator protein A [Clostridium puniceum]